MGTTVSLRASEIAGDIALMLFFQTMKALKVEPGFTCDQVRLDSA